MKALTREQVNIFMATAGREKAHYFPIFLTLYQTGVRIGECVGLQWPDLRIDPKVREIEVQRSIDDKTGAVGTTKSSKAQGGGVAFTLHRSLLATHVRHAAP